MAGHECCVVAIVVRSNGTQDRFQEIVPSEQLIRTKEALTLELSALRLRTPMKVSIIIAVYNEASTVATLLNRVWAQPLPETSKEIVIVESNSTDGSREIVADFLARHAADS